MAATLRTIFIALVMLVISTGQGLAQWEITYGPASLTFNRVTCFTKIGTNLLGGTWGDGVWISTDNSASPWTKVSNGLTGKYVSALLANGTNLIAGTDSGAFLSTNNGTNWIAINNGLTTINITSLAIIGTNLFAATFGGGVFLSTNNGTSWDNVSSGLPTFISSLAVIGANLFAANGGFGGVFLSTNSGISWDNVSSGLPSNIVLSFGVSGTNLFAGTSGGGVFLTTDGGTSWNLASTGLPNSIEVCFAVSGINVFAGAYSNGVFLTTDNGTNWIDVNDGFGFSRTISCLAVLGDDLFAGFYNGGVRRRPLSQMITAVDDYSNIPVEFNLAQNYPNPFNPSTIIRYSVPNVPLSGVEGSRVQLRVYDVLGTEVATLVNEEKPAGSYEVEFSSKGLSSGIYLYKIQAGSFVSAKKMILIK